MLTVKIIDGHGNQNVLQAMQVNAYTGKSKKIEKVWFSTPDNAEIEIEGRYALVYVMNENGKTVADYIIGAGEKIE